MCWLHTRGHGSLAELSLRSVSTKLKLDVAECDNMLSIHSNKHVQETVPLKKYLTVSKICFISEKIYGYKHKFGGWFSIGV